PSEMQDYEKLLAETLPAGTACRGLVHMWGVDATPWDEVTTDNLIPDIRTATFSVVRLIQAAVGHGFRDGPKLVLVTRGGVVVRGEVSIAGGGASSLWGLGRVIAVERPELSCVRVDVDPASPSGSVERLVRELLESDGEDQIVFRDENRLVAR